MIESREREALATPRWPSGVGRETASKVQIARIYQGAWLSQPSLGKRTTVLGRIQHYPRPPRRALRRPASGGLRIVLDTTCARPLG